MKNSFVLKDKACPGKLFCAYGVSQPEAWPSPADLMPQKFRVQVAPLTPALKVV